MDLPQLDALVDDAREASGGIVRLIVSGAVTRLDPGVELAAYRILAKPGLRDRAQAVAAAYESGLVVPGREHG